MSATGEYHFDFASAGVSAAEVQARFDRLQAKLKPLWKSIQAMSQDPQTIVVTPCWLDGSIRSSHVAWPS